MRRHFGEEPKEEIWWALFSGRSAKRAELETPPLDITSAPSTINISEALSLKGLLNKSGAVENAPEQPGPHIAQVMLTSALALVALLISFVITFLLRMYTNIF
jgi:hypothetical protein